MLVSSTSCDIHVLLLMYFHVHHFRLNVGCVHYFDCWNSSEFTCEQFDLRKPFTVFARHMLGNVHKILNSGSFGKVAPCLVIAYQFEKFLGKPISFTEFNELLPFFCLVFRRWTGIKIVCCL